MTEEPVARGLRIVRAHEEFRFMPTLLRLLSRGKPVSVEHLAAESGTSAAEVRKGLDREPGVDWDEGGRILGFGMTLRETPHRFDFDGRTVFGWCASDALSFPVILKRRGVVSSTCPATGTRIQVEVTPERVVEVDPAHAVVTSVRPEAQVRGLRSEICALGHFFRDDEAAARWLEANPEGFVNAVQRDFEIHKEILEKLGWEIA